MTNDAITPQLRDIFTAMFGLEPGQFSDALSQDDLPAWDSVTHVTLVLMLESRFGIEFGIEEAQAMTSVKLIRLTLEERLGGRGAPS